MEKTKKGYNDAGARVKMLEDVDNLKGMVNKYDKDMADSLKRAAKLQATKDALRKKLDADPELKSLLKQVQDQNQGYAGGDIVYELLKEKMGPPTPYSGEGEDLVSDLPDEHRSAVMADYRGDAKGKVRTMEQLKKAVELINKVDEED